MSVRPDRGQLVATAFALLVAGAMPAAGQGWSADVQGGRLRWESGLPVSSGLAVGVRNVNGRQWVRGVVGVPLADADPWSLSAGAGGRASGRWGVLEAGVDLTGHGYLVWQRLREPGGLLGTGTDRTAFAHGLAGEALPVGGIRFGPLRLEARAGLAAYRGEFGDDERVDRSARLADAQLTYAPDPAIALTAGIRRVEVEGEEFTTASLMLAGATDRAVGWGTIGYWNSASSEDMSWSLGATVYVTDRIGVLASARHDPLEPLFGLPARTSWSIGLTARLSRAATVAAPVPASYVGGRATIVLEASVARGSPRIAGDFNGWTPAPMQRTGDRWTYTVAMAPGVYHYAFVDDAGEWYVPQDVPGRRDDGMGGHVAVVVVQ